MVDERFTIDYVTNDILDKEDYDETDNMGVTFYNCEDGHIERLCDLLNSQDNTIKQLTILLKEAEDEIKMLKQSNKVLQESLLES